MFEVASFMSRGSTCNMIGHKVVDGSKVLKRFYGQGSYAAAKRHADWLNTRANNAAIEDFNYVGSRHHY